MMTRRVAVRLLATLIATGSAGAVSRAKGPAEHVAAAFSTSLPNVPGDELTAVVVDYPPGGVSRAHHHAGSVYAYVLSGDIRSKNSATGAARSYRVGQSFFEPPGSHHEISENASRTRPARLLAIFIAPKGATLTTDEAR